MFTDRKTPPDEADRSVQRLLSVRDVRSLENSGACFLVSPEGPMSN